MAARSGSAGKMANDKHFVCSPPVPAGDHPARGVALRFGGFLIAAGQVAI